MADTVIPGGSVTLVLQVKDSIGAALNLTGSIVTTEVAAPGVNSEVAASVTDDGTTKRKIVISGAQTRARAGKRVRVRAWVAFASSLDEVPAEFSFVVGA